MLVNNSEIQENQNGKILKRSSLKNLIIFSTAFTSFLTAFSTSSITVALPVIAREFMIDAILQNWLAISFLLAIAVFSVPFGKLSGKFGIKRFFSLGIVLLIVGTTGSALSFSAYSLIFFRVIQGIAGSMINVAGFTMLTKALPPRERGKGIGINVSCVYAGLTLAPVLGGILTKNLGWQSIFYIIIPLLFIPLFLALYKIREEWVLEKDHPFDFTGTIIYCIAIILFIYGFTIINQATGMVLTVIGVLLLAVFVLFELRRKSPVFHVELFRNVKFASANLAALISYLATFVITYILNYYFQYIRNYDPQTTGFILIATPAIMAVIAPFSGKLSDKIEPQKLAATGMVFVAISLFILIFINENTPLAFIIISMVLQGIGIGVFSSPNANSVMSSVPGEFTPLASATISTVRVIGQTMSLGMLTVIFAVVMGTVPIIPEYYPLLIKSSQIAFIISTILCAIAITISLVGIKFKTNRQRNPD